LLIISDCFLLKSSLKGTLGKTKDEYKVRTSDDILEAKDKHNEREIGILLIVITNKKGWFQNLMGICKAARFNNTKIVVCTSYTDEKTHKLLATLRLAATFSIYATESEIIELFIDVNNNETRFLLPKDAYTGTIKTGKKNRTVMGGYIMKADLKTVVRLRRKGQGFKQITEENNFNIRTIQGWVRRYRKESKTNSPLSDYKYAVDNGLMEEGE